MRAMGPGELRLLGRLAIDPALQQASLAKELHVTRSAVNQIWKILESENGLRIRGSLDFGKIGFKMVFGWARAGEESDVLEKFHRWLKSSRLVILALKSQISSTFESLVYFEALSPLDNHYSWFQSQIERFRKKPYSLAIEITECLKVSHHLNLGLFDGTNWSFPDSFRLQASIGAARRYVDILPAPGIIEQSTPTTPNLNDMIVAAAIESDYHATATTLLSLCDELGLKHDSSRTLRRRIAQSRGKIARPYIEISSIGLDQHIMILIRDEIHAESEFSRLLHAQAGTFPKARVLSGPGLTLLDLEVPGSIKWLPLSQVITDLAGSSSEICTFIADERNRIAQLKSVVSYLASPTSSR